MANRKKQWHYVPKRKTEERVRPTHVKMRPKRNKVRVIS